MEVSWVLLFEDDDAEPWSIVVPAIPTEEAEAAEVGSATADGGGSFRLGMVSGW